MRIENSLASGIDAAVHTLEQVFAQVGDMLGDIAKRYGFSESALRQANPDLGDRLLPGQSVQLPARAQEAAATVTDRVPVMAAPQEATYIVRSRDTLSGIAKAHGVSLRALIEANPQITNSNRIAVGQTIHLPKGQGEAAPHRADTARARAAPPVASPVARAEQPTIAPAGTQTGAHHSRGDLSSRYETGGRGPGTVSTGRGDHGGVSYGSYQLATNAHRPQQFLAHEGAQWAPQFAGQTPGTPEFSATWRRIAQQEPQAFHAAQHRFIERTHYDPSVSRTLNRTGLDVNQRSAALQDVVWSTAVQHGPGNDIVAGAVRKVDARMSRNDPGYDSAVIHEIYAERGRRDPDGNLHYFRSSSHDQQQGVARRFVREEADAQRMLTQSH
jgi:LysM repeat protein